MQDSENAGQPPAASPPERAPDRVIDPQLRLRIALRKRAIETIYAPRPAPVTFPIRQRFNNLYPYIAETIGEGVPLTYLEFGVWRGASIKRMSQLFTSPEARFVGFDSFEGLPEAWGEKPTGTFSMDGQMPRTQDPRVSYVKGYFQNTLPGFIAGQSFKMPVLVHLDADLYSSTLFLLTTLWHHIPEYYFLFDEFPNDEAAAMYDFGSAYPVEFEFLACTQLDDAKPMPQQLFGRMRNVPLVV